jgi:type IV pilus assembly protein PilN
MIKINLAPPPAKKKLQLSVPSFNLGWLFGILFAVLVVVLGGWWWTLDSEVDRLNHDITENKKEIDRLKTLIAEGQRFKKEKEDLERRVTAIDAVARKQTRPVYLLDNFVDAVPRDLWITRMEERGNQLRLAGTTYSSTVLADFMANLRASGKFADVDLVESRQDLSKPVRTITFEVTCRYEI